MNTKYTVGFEEADDTSAFFINDAGFSVLRVRRIGEDEVGTPEHKKQLLTDDQWAAALKCLDVGNKVAIAREWSDQQLRLLCGEMTAQEIRTVRAVLNFLSA
jgi:hypothetical protein